MYFSLFMFVCPLSFLSVIYICCCYVVAEAYDDEVFNDESVVHLTMYMHNYCAPYVRGGCPGFADVSEGGALYTFHTVTNSDYLLGDPEGALYDWLTQIADRPLTACGAEFIDSVESVAMDQLNTAVHSLLGPRFERKTVLIHFVITAHVMAFLTGMPRNLFIHINVLQVQRSLAALRVHRRQRWLRHKKPHGYLGMHEVIPAPTVTKCDKCLHAQNM
ncbi:EO4 protein [Japanese eel endothelial cells-infecting virus]|uniref:EO4 protein n=1 Tax=Japanese eel endothelial cells-infecting virus TaxID=712037 RepID=UPI00052E684B|nr:EO4 protein [Japanese eel endothelial cells-infecting virus]